MESFFGFTRINLLHSIGTIAFVEEDEGLEIGGESSGQDIFGLGLGTFGGIHHEQKAVGKSEIAIDFARKVRMSGYGERKSDEQ